MKFPKGAIWQDLRSSFLQVVPPRTKSQYSRPRTLREWRGSGFYIVTQATSKRFDVLAAAPEISGVILSEAEFFLDHAAEHQVTISHHVHEQNWCSSAWLVVTAYYWAFYSGLALSRLLGDSVVFLDRSATDAFRTLATTQAGSPGPGAFRFKCGPLVTATERQLVFAKTSGRLHDLLWKVLFERFDACSQTVNADKTNQLEYRLFSALSGAVKQLRAEWPSTIRNAVNYQPGYGYVSVRQFAPFEVASYVRKPRQYGISEAVEKFENQLAAASMAEGADGRPAARMLLMLSILLHAISIEAHRDLIDRNSLDSRWSAARATFVRKHGLATEEGVWPW